MKQSLVETAVPAPTIQGIQRPAAQLDASNAVHHSLSVCRRVEAHVAINGGGAVGFVGLFIGLQLLLHVAVHCREQWAEGYGAGFTHFFTLLAIFSHDLYMFHSSHKLKLTHSPLERVKIIKRIFAVDCVLRVV